MKHDLLTRLRLRVDVEAIAHPNGRVVVFHVPPQSSVMAMSEKENPSE